MDLRDDGRLTVLHAGCGGRREGRLPDRFRGWREIRLDADPQTEPDVVADITDMPAVGKGSVDAVYSSHTLEHLHYHDVPRALKEFFRVLKPGGFVFLTMPDLQQAAARLARGEFEETIYDSPMGAISALDVAFGHRASLAAGRTWMAHKTGFSAALLAKRLTEAGFAFVRSRAIELDLWAEGVKP